MTARSIFDADMSVPVIPARPRPDEMAMTERRLAKAMAEEARHNRHMRYKPWQTGAATPSASRADRMLGTINPLSLQARIWRHIDEHGPQTIPAIAVAMGEAETKVREAVQNLVRRRAARRSGRWKRGAEIEAVRVGE